MSRSTEWQLELGAPGPLRDRLVAAVLDGSKTASTLTREQLPDRDEDLPVVGGRHELVDSAGAAVGTIELDAISAVPLGDVTMEHVRRDSARFTTVDEWRAAHVAAWEAAGSPSTPFDDHTVVFTLRFHVV